MPYFVGCGAPDVIHEIPESSRVRVSFRFKTFSWSGKVTWVTFAELFHADMCHISIKTIYNSHTLDRFI